MVPVSAQLDEIGSGRAITFDGVDDYIDAGNILDDLDFPFTVSAWVYLDENNPGGPVFVSQDNSGIYNGFWFYVRKEFIFLEYGDGRGENNPAFRRGKKADFGSDITDRWFHATVVVNGIDQISIFLNGKDIGGYITGESSYPMASNYPTDVAKVGYFLSNGVVYRFKGKIDDLRVFNRALTEQEIRDGMCRKIPGATEGLAGYWSFDEISGIKTFDKSVTGSHAELKNSPTRQFSGAPIGDESIHTYTSSWAEKSIVMDSVVVSEVTGNPAGVQLYKVNSSPSQTDGIAAEVHRYYGVFATTEDAGNAFTVTVDHDCGLYERHDNSRPTWMPMSSPDYRSQRVEITAAKQLPNISLGNDSFLCEGSSKELAANVEITGASYEWSTGQTSSTITVDEPGLYWVKVTNECGLEADSIKLEPNIGPSLDLGSDFRTCETSVEISAVQNSGADFRYEWTTGEAGAIIVVSESGTYGVEVSNDCGISTDLVTIDFDLPPAVKLADDTISCAPSLTLEPEITAGAGATVLWSTGEQTASITVNSSDQYYIEVSNNCGLAADSMFVEFRMLPDLDLGTDRTVCEPSAALTAQDGPDFPCVYKWNTGQNTSSISVTRSGLYSVEVDNGCSVVTDSIFLIFETAPPAFTLGPDEMLCPGMKKTAGHLVDTTRFELAWSDGTTGGTLVPKASGLYWLDVGNACGTQRDSIQLEIMTLENTIVPNIITPNDDQRNDFLVFPPGMAGSDIALYNRWGRLVYEARNYSNGFNAEGLSSGVYYYTLRTSCFGPMRGTLHIIK